MRDMAAAPASRRSLVSPTSEIGPEVRQPTLDEATFPRLRRQWERTFVCAQRFRHASQSAAEVGPRRHATPGSPCAEGEPH